MSLVRGTFLALLMLVGWNANGGALKCSEAHRWDPLSVFLQAEAVRATENNFRKYSTWLGETTPSISFERVQFDSTIGGAQHDFSLNRISLSRSLMKRFGPDYMKPFTVTLMHEYTHAHLDRLLMEGPYYPHFYTKVKRHDETRSYAENSIIKKQHEMIDGVHELIADIFPSLALKEPNVIATMLGGIPLSSKIYSQETLQKMVAARKFEDNDYAYKPVWLHTMSAHARIFDNWDPYMLYAFARPKLWKRAQEISKEKGQPASHEYLRNIARTLIREILGGRLKNGPFTLENFLHQTETILVEIDPQYPR